MMYPIIISSAGICVGIVTLLIFDRCYPIDNADQSSVEKALKGILNISTVMMAKVVGAISFLCLPSVFTMTQGGAPVKWWYCADTWIMVWPSDWLRCRVLYVA